MSKKDHNWFYPIDERGKITIIRTKTSHGGGKKYKELGDDLVGKMARQLKLTTKQLREFVSCT